MKYCSIDLEFTGFNPETEQILEIGFVFFDVTDQGIILGEKWQQVFKPTIPVHEKIFGLTGITKEELEHAPNIQDYIEELTNKLQDKILVAHNPTLDVKFLESAGVKLSGQVIDTLELVQFLLPTHHSYNLENLAHYFSITHTDSHRALSDAMATAFLLEKLLIVFTNLKTETQEELKEIIFQENFSWAPLFTIKLDQKEILTQDSLFTPPSSKLKELDFSSNIIFDEDVFEHAEHLVENLEKQNEKTILVLPSDQVVLDLSKKNQHEALFLNTELFNHSSFKKFKAEATTPEQKRFILKILVWLSSNWQTRTILDLNLSFFGGQFKQFIVGGDIQTPSSNLVLMSYNSFVNFEFSSWAKSYKLVIAEIENFEQFLTNKNQFRFSWQSLLYNVRKHFYIDGTLTDTPLVLEKAIYSIDLFFSIAHIELSRFLKQTGTTDLQRFLLEDSIGMKKLNTALSNLITSLQPVFDMMPIESAENLKTRLGSILDIGPDFVSWVEFEPGNLVFVNQLLDIASISKKMFTNFVQVKFSSHIPEEQILLFLSVRLGFNIELTDKFNIVNNQSYITLGNLEELGTHLKDKVNKHVVVFNSTNQLSDFYKQNYEAFNKDSHLLAERYSGSGNKIFRNFNLFVQPVLLCTPEFILKQKYILDCNYITIFDELLLDTNSTYIIRLIEFYIESFPDIKLILQQKLLILLINKLNLHKKAKIFVNNIDNS